MLKEKLQALSRELKDSDPEQSAFFKEVYQHVLNLEVDNSALKGSKEVLIKALEKYADKNFWIRVPPYSLAAADKGQIALMALLQAGDSHNA